MTDVDLSGVWLGVFALAFLAVLACLLLEVVVVLFNRPKFVVPPPVRSDPGVLATRGARGPRGD
ncbi:hypothetical protein [Streptomyces sp. NPDC005752]|uniref:hypothetical protein n=1 Tax=Streptomyces sp. NPDC005752 TaxID=3157065 RepID=UPI0033DD2ABB